MAEDIITLYEFNKLPLEERTKKALKNYFYEERKITCEGPLINFIPFIQAWGYSQEKGYVELEGSTYNLTENGHNFLGR